MPFQEKLRAASHLRKVQVVTASLAVVAAGAIVATSVMSDDVELARAPLKVDGDRVLQSVDVQIGPDGTLTAVNGTVVSSTGDDSSTTTAAYAPGAVEDQLPVRVLTAYRTDDGAGTDLSELDGHTGRVQIDVTIQNLTVSPEQVTYDVDGTARTAEALVGAPLTVTAAASLDGTDSADVVTADPGSDAAGTNGVLSQASDGGTQVQWATILAPPQLSSSARLSLVVDAEDFSVPAFDISVQPGLVTDPSVGALVDTAFNPARSPELELQSRTIELIAEVNRVLARASETIGTVRTTLDSSAETLGEQTVRDLEASTTSVARSMSALEGALGTLGSDLTSTLETTESATLAQFAETVTALDEMLGDTSAQPKPLAVKGSGCDTEVTRPAAADSMFANLLRVAAQLNAYAGATTACRDTLTAEIAKSVGPANPDAPGACVRSSVTCSLAGVGAKFADIAGDLLARGDTAVAALDPASMTEAIDAANALGDEVDTLIADVAALLASDNFVATETELEGLATRVETLETRIGQLEGAVTTAHDLAEDALGDVDAMTAQTTGVADELCDLVGTDVGQLAAADAERLRAQLANTTCAGDPQPGPADALQDKIAAQKVALGKVVAATDQAATVEGSFGAVLAALETEVTNLADAIADTLDSLGEGEGSLARELAALEDQVDAVEAAGADAQARITAIGDQRDDVVAAVEQAFEDAADATAAQIAGAVDPEIRRVTEQSATDRAQLVRMFDRSAAGLAAAATSGVEDGRALLEKQKRTSRATQRAAERELSRGLEQGLTTVTSGISSSTRDLGAAAALLTADLNRVLLDLGSREVGGGGLLGAMTTGAATARSADYQLALASGKASSYANVRGQELDAILLRQAQAEAALQRQASLRPFALDIPSGSQHRTVYSFHLRGDR